MARRLRSSSVSCALCVKRVEESFDSSLSVILRALCERNPIPLTESTEKHSGSSSPLGNWILNIGYSAR